LKEADAVANDQHSQTDNLRSEERRQAPAYRQIAIVNVTSFGVSARHDGWLPIDTTVRGRGL
jgi:hypothetical protein